jgi:hypothetical protein
MAVQEAKESIKALKHALGDGEGIGVGSDTGSSTGKGSSFGVWANDPDGFLQTGDSLEVPHLLHVGSP